MKTFAFITACCICNIAYAQITYEFAPGRYNISTTDTFKKCADAPVLEYYSAHVKYNYSGQGLLKKFRTVYKKPNTALQSGFITIRFLVNCKGQKGFYNIYQTDLNNEAQIFNTEVTGQISNFVETLNDFPIATLEQQEVNYFYYFSFKIINNEIKTISP